MREIPEAENTMIKSFLFWPAESETIQVNNCLLICLLVYMCKQAELSGRSALNLLSVEYKGYISDNCRLLFKVTTCIASFELTVTVNTC